MKPKRLTFMLHLFGREIFSLSFEWISTDPCGGHELATPLHMGTLSDWRKRLSIQLCAAHS
jgi:hypothetical protein